MNPIWYAYIFALQRWNTYFWMKERIIDKICGLYNWEEIEFRYVDTLTVDIRRLLLVGKEDIDQILLGLATSS